MKKTFLIIILCIFTLRAYAANVIPADLAGEWATDKTEFNGGALSKGNAIYLKADGNGAFIAAPPPIGSKGTASYDAKTEILTLTLTENGKSMTSIDFIYDSKTKLLKSRKNEFGKDAFKRRQDSVPDYIIEMLK